MCLCVGMGVCTNVQCVCVCVLKQVSVCTLVSMSNKQNVTQFSGSKLFCKLAEIVEELSCARKTATFLLFSLVKICDKSAFADELDLWCLSVCSEDFKLLVWYMHNFVTFGVVYDCNMPVGLSHVYVKIHNDVCQQCCISVRMLEYILSVACTNMYKIIIKTTQCNAWQINTQ